MVKMQLLQHVQVDKTITVKQADATESYTWLQPPIAKQALFKEISDSIKANIVNKEDDFIDFNIQKLLPHKLSDYGPAIAVADVDGNGTDDLAIGGAYGYSTQILYQQKKWFLYFERPYSAC